MPKFIIGIGETEEEIIEAALISGLSNNLTYTVKNELPHYCEL